MPPFLSDPSPTLYVLLIALVVVAAVVAARYQSRRTLIALGIAALPLLAVILIDRFVESPREESVRKVRELAAAVNAKDWTKLGANVSDRFDADGMKKADLGRRAKQAGDAGVQVSVDAFDRSDVEEVSPTEIRLGFMAQVSSPLGSGPVYVKAIFGKDADGQFRLTGFDAYSPTQRTPAGKIKIPGP